jgi:hypothetical protein
VTVPKPPALHAFTWQAWQQRRGKRIFRNGLNYFSDPNASVPAEYSFYGITEQNLLTLPCTFTPHGHFRDRLRNHATFA